MDLAHHLRGTGNRSVRPSHPIVPATASPSAVKVIRRPPLLPSGAVNRDPYEDPAARRTDGPFVLAESGSAATVFDPDG